MGRARDFEFGREDAAGFAPFLIQVEQKAAKIGIAKLHAAMNATGLQLNGTVKAELAAQQPCLQVVGIGIHAAQFRANGLEGLFDMIGAESIEAAIDGRERIRGVGRLDRFEFATIETGTGVDGGDDLARQFDLLRIATEVEVLAIHGEASAQIRNGDIFDRHGVELKMPDGQWAAIGEEALHGDGASNPGGGSSAAQSTFFDVEI